MKIRETISNDLDLNECYPGHDSKQEVSAVDCYVLRNASADCIVTFKHHNSKST